MPADGQHALVGQGPVERSRLASGDVPVSGAPVAVWLPRAGPFPARGPRLRSRPPATAFPQRVCPSTLHEDVEDVTRPSGSAVRGASREARVRARLQRLSFVSISRRYREGAPIRRNGGARGCRIRSPRRALGTSWIERPFSWRSAGLARARRHSRVKARRARPTDPRRDAQPSLGPEHAWGAARWRTPVQSTDVCSSQYSLFSRSNALSSRRTPHHFPHGAGAIGSRR